jgi:AraC-like DNA-binding protein
VPYDGTNIRWENRRIHTDNVVFGEVLYRAKGACGPRIQRDFELVTLHSGECQATVEGVSRDLAIGKVYLFLPGRREHFQFAVERETHQSWCAVRAEFMPKSVQSVLRGAAFSASCSELFHVLQAAAFKLRGPLQDSSTSAMIDQLGICLFTEFLHTSREPNPAFGDPAVASFLNYIESHFGEENCLESAREAANISRNALIYKFRNALKSTPANYLWNYRVERGIAMLKETGHSIAEIAYQCGFSNPFHFSRKVKEKLGSSPRDIRRKAS